MTYRPPNTAGTNPYPYTTTVSNGTLRTVCGAIDHDFQPLHIDSDLGSKPIVVIYCRKCGEVRRVEVPA